ncbi:hypothetical protein CBR_g52229 [Chara braunii]|uniref:Uncharacterized protein n=1 Tax=Chara braunii TaxID=69332 RepID=A0A388MA28_CHABU|nr:hypothetical protein CBR_g52229 [Chara braunii]|eukprot:GBG91343.1 hypothetical protein CBR_g52229 [Chara braunii]
MRKEVVIAVLQGYHRVSRTSAAGFMKTLEYVFFDEGVDDPADFTLDNYRLAFGEDDDFNIEIEQEESVEDDLFDFNDQLAIFNAQVVSESPSVCKPGTPLATPTSDGPTTMSSSTPVKRVGLSHPRSSSGESLSLTPHPERLQPRQPVPPDHPHLLNPARPYHMGDKHTFSKAEDWGHDIVWHPDHFQPVLLDGEWAVAVKDLSGGWEYDDRWDLDTFKSQAYKAVVEKLSEANRRRKGDPALRAYANLLFDLLQSNKWLEVSSVFYSLPWSPSLNHAAERGKRASREKKKPHSGEKTKHHRGDGQGSDVDDDEEGAALAVTCNTSMETGNDFRPWWILRPGEQDSIIDAKDGTCPAQVQTQFADCLGSIRTTETTSLFRTLCVGGSKTTTYLVSDYDKLEQLPFSVSPHQEVRINPNLVARTVKTAHRSTELEWMVWVYEQPASEIRIDLNQENVSAMTADRCKDADSEMLCMEAAKELQADCSSFKVGVRDNAMESLEGELAPSSNVESLTLGEEFPVMKCTSLTVLNDSAVKADTSAPSDSIGARMNPSLGDVSMSVDDAALETAVIRMHPKETDAGLELDGVECCGHVTTFDKADGSFPLHSAEDRIHLKPSDVSMPHDTSGNEMRPAGLDQRVRPGYEDPLYSGLHDEAIGEDIMKKASDAVKDGLLYLSDDDKDTMHQDKKLRGEEVLLDIHGTFSSTQYDTGAVEKTQPVNVVDLDALSPEKSGIKLSIVNMEDLHHWKEFMPSPIIDADISNLSSFPGGLEHVIAASMRRGSPIVLGLPSVDSGDVEAKPGKH